MRSVASAFCEIVGLALIAAGAFVLAPWAGLAVAGAGLVAVGLAMDT